MKKGLKIAAITVGVIIILMFLLPFAFQGKIADIVKTEGNKMLNAQFDFKNLNISLFRNFPQASVTLEDFWLKGTGEFANDTLVQAGEVTAAVNLFSLFGDSGYDISKIFIEDTYRLLSRTRIAGKYIIRTGAQRPRDRRHRSGIHRKSH